MRTAAVFWWGVSGSDPLTPAPTQPAIRAWGDALIELIDERQERRALPPVSLRSTAVFAWTEPEPPARLAEAFRDRRRYELRVITSACASARADLIDAVFDAATWRGAGEHLVDRGFERDYLEEELVTLTAPMTAMHVDRARSAVESTGADLLEEILRYFTPLVVPYLESWGPFEDHEQEPSDALWDVVIPPGAIIEVVDRPG